MIVPIRQLYGMKAQKAFRFGHHGLIVIIKGHEELFLEFHSARRRDELMALLEERMDDLRQVSQATHAIEDMLPGTPAFTDDMSGTGDAEPATGQGLMFNSTTSSFLQFKPDPMTIVCLTIGSRGDVQPYIALCKGLLAEGHTCRIATHAEYKDWVEGVSALCASMLTLSTVLGSLPWAATLQSSWSCVLTTACSPSPSSRRACRCSAAGSTTF